MIRRVLISLASCLSALTVQASSGLHDVELHDLYFGEVLYYAYQDKYFEALSKLDNELSQYYEVDEKALDPLHRHLSQAEFSVGDLEMQYRMNQRAGKAIQAVLGEGVDLATRNLAALQLARVYYRKGEPQSVLYALDLIREEPEKSRYEARYTLDVLRGKPPESFSKEVAYLRALAYIDTGQFSQAAEILQTLRNEKLFEGFVLYNLGIALTRSGQTEAGLRVFDELGQLETDDETLKALKDKVNIKLAYLYVDSGNAASAQKYFERVRLDGPFSNRALLGAGWVAASQGRYDRALVPWSLLHKRSEINPSVQEAMMAVPYAYGKLQAYGKSANLYGEAMDVFAREIGNLDASIKSIRKGRFLKALLDEHGDKDKNWVVNLRSLPETPETRYILELMAANDFQESYKNYRDLAGLRHYLVKWLDDLDVFEELIELRRIYQEPLLPVVEEKFRKIDARMRLRLEQRDNLNTKINNMLIAPRPEYLATVDERIALDRLTRIKEYIAAHPERASSEINSRVGRLDGVLLWRVRSEFDQRLT
ncbi:MAG TPA: tetratricopeptide repeat protein, partial [Thiotrichales bacterium]|nr:tetratricopeptide repeat protein [Thiotrichales bacterium]